MNLFAFADMHGDRKKFEAIKKKAKGADVIICAGDLTIFENNYAELLAELDSLGIQTFVIHGNHEGEASTHQLTKNLKNTLFIHRKIIKYKDYYFLGWGGGGFTNTEPEFEKKRGEFEKTLKVKPSLFITHAPPYNTPLDHLHHASVGCKSFRSFIEKVQPRVAISGHIHETAKATGRIGKTFLINPGPDGNLIKVNHAP